MGREGGREGADLEASDLVIATAALRLKKHRIEVQRRRAERRHVELPALPTGGTMHTRVGVRVRVRVRVRRRWLSSTACLSNS